MKIKNDLTINLTMAEWYNTLEEIIRSGKCTLNNGGGRITFIREQNETKIEEGKEIHHLDDAGKMLVNSSHKEKE